MIKYTMDLKNPKYLVYIHKKFNSDIPFYVGACCDSNRNRPFDSSQRSKEWLEIVNQADGKFDVFIISEGLTQKESFDLEIKMIEEIGKIINGTGTLVNITDGGPGRPGFKVSKETKILMSESAQTRWDNSSTKDKKKHADSVKKYYKKENPILLENRYKKISESLKMKYRNDPMMLTNLSKIKKGNSYHCKPIIGGKDSDQKIEYKSIKEASKITGSSISSIYTSLRNNKSVNGYSWNYKQKL